MKEKLTLKGQFVYRIVLYKKNCSKCMYVQFIWIFFFHIRIFSYLRSNFWVKFFSFFSTVSFCYYKLQPLYCIVLYKFFFFFFFWTIFSTCCHYHCSNYSSMLISMEKTFVQYKWTNFISIFYGHTNIYYPELKCCRHISWMTHEHVFIVSKKMFSCQNVIKWKNCNQKKIWLLLFFRLE